jgi:hypothetical protein
MKQSDFTLSRILSFILHPLLIPTLVISALMPEPGLYSIVLPDTLKLWFLSMISLFTLAIPVGSILILYRLNAINSIEMSHSNERTIPLLIAGASYMALLFLIRPTNIPPVFLYILYSATFSLLAGLLINLVYKISLHTLGWGALTATLTGISIYLGTPLLPYIIIAVLLSGLAGYARLKEKAHNQAQVYWGYVAGVFIIILITFLA